ncbi:MAG: ATP-grasp domain-containing protein [Candidatus Zhuqueibacterota bacterium]
MDQFKTNRGEKSLRAGTGALVCGGHFQGLGVIRSLGRKGIPVTLIDNEMSIGRFSRYLSDFHRCPDVRDESEFLQFLIDLALKAGKKGWVIFPTDDETVYVLSRFREELSPHFRITIPGWEVIRYTYEKKNTYQLAQSMGIPIPKTWYPGDESALASLPLNFPVLLKPSVVKKFFNVRKKKAFIARNSEQLSVMYREMAAVIPADEILVQEMIPGGPEHLYSFCPLVNNGKIAAQVTARRSRQHPMDLGHASTFVETIHIPELEATSARLLNRIGYEGLAEVEYKFDPTTGEYKLLDINTRVWGWHTLAIRAGVDLPYLLFQTMLGEPVTAPDFQDGVRWIRLMTDVPTVFFEIIKSRMQMSVYLKTLRRPMEFAVLSKDDILPCLAELVLLPYLYYKRGF